MEIGLVLLVLFLFMFVQGVILAFILVRLSERQNTQARVEDIDRVLNEIQELKKPAKKAPTKKAPAKKTVAKKPAVKKGVKKMTKKAKK